MNETAGRAPQQSYRRDIDGLRAVAVGAVVLFHAFPSVLKSGYVGVDVFFVISGYLISNVILGGLSRGDFSFGRFYANRARRILPALLVVLVSCYAFGWISLFPDEFTQLGEQIAASVAFIQNFVLWQEAGYFDTASGLKPLLHLWSLSVEEQFYLIYPVILVLASRRQCYLWAAVGILGLVSFTVNIADVAGQLPSAFFLPLPRFWELMAGGALACCERSAISHSLAFQRLYPGIGATPAWDDILSFAGLAAVAGSAFIFGGGTAYPGWRALLPVAGACLLIQAGPNGWCNRRILSDRRLVFIGLISYPLYLWHWPLLSFLRVLDGKVLPIRARLVAIALSVLLAWLTYIVVERPIRFGSRSRARIVALCSLTAAIGAVGYLTFLQGGLPSRQIVEMNPTIASGGIDAGDDHMVAGCGIADADNFLLCHHDGRGAATFAIYGDSKAGALAKGLLAASGPDDRWLLIGQPKTPLFSPLSEFGKEALDVLVRNADVKLVVLTLATRNLFGIWNDRSIESLPTSPNSDIAFDTLDKTVGLLVASGKKVVITIDNPTLHDPKFCVARATAIRQIDWLVGIGGKRSGCWIGYDRHLALTAKYRAVLDRLARKYPNHLRVFDPLPILCDATKGECSFLMNGRLLYSYGDHISQYAALMIAKKLVPFIETFAAEPAVPDNRP